MSSDSPLLQALDKYHNGETETALAQMQQLLLDEPHNPEVRIEFANILMREKRFEDANELLQSLSAEDKKKPAAIALIIQLESISTIIDAPDLETLLETIKQNPKDCLAREQLAAHYKLRGDYAAAMEQLLEIVRYDRSYKDEFARKELLNLFILFGSDHELVSLYRRKLALLLN